ncbi:MAG: PHP domain-containing protein [bacterium]
MKRIDLHVHTVKSILDSYFEFDINKFNEYICRMKLDVVAITNHNLFDLVQFKSIEENTDITILPGIEISLESGHLLLISDNQELEDFSIKCNKINNCINDKEDIISLEKFKEIFSDLSRYIIIPHYDKKPKLNDATIKELEEYITAGEVKSVKKFMYAIKDTEKLVPVLFSDIRISNELDIDNLTARQTFIDINEYSFSGLKLCLCDKNKVSLSIHEGQSYFQVLENGVYLSTGLNVILGKRSSGKSYTLDKISQTIDRVKYIEQFSLLERDKEKEKEKFNKLLRTKQSYVTQNHLREFKSVVDDVINIDTNADLLDLDKYIKSLKKYAFEQEKSDSFSKSKLFNEPLFSESSLDNIKKLIESAILLSDNVEYRKIIDNYIAKDDLAKLIVELINEFVKEEEKNLKKRWLNELIENIKKDLVVRTATTQIKDIDFMDIAMNNLKIKKFIDVTKLVMIEREIDRKNVQGFNVVASTCRFSGAQELKNLSGRQTAFSSAYKKYDNPYEYLQELKLIELLEDTEIYKYFVNIDYKILNEDNFEVSGGERSEYNLLQQISDALEYDILLLDEPESSFDNLFLKDNVNELIKSISSKIPVVVVTHNNTIGASINPDFILFTKKIVENSNIKYKIYFGHPTDKKLRSIDGESIDNIDIIYDCLEAGKTAYTERGKTYEILEN